jgi:antitoxin component of MazEF toxin-antitoxin module
MELKICKIGNSKGLIIPSPILKTIQCELAPGEEIWGFDVAFIGPVIERK